VARPRLAPLAVLIGLLVPASAFAVGPPGERMASIAKTAHAQHSVHYVSVQKQGATTLTIVADAGPAAGIQRITYREGARTGHLTVIVAHRTAYMRGDVFTLTRFLGFPQAPARKLADTWLRIRHTSTAYAPVAEDVTFGSAMDDLAPPGRLTGVKRTKLAGQAVVGIRGSTKIQGQKVVKTVWVAASGKPLIVSQVTTAPGGSVTITYSAWNRPVHVSAPRDFIDSETGKASGTVA
jgi:hypothetical protein